MSEKVNSHGAVWNHARWEDLSISPGISLSKAETWPEPWGHIIVLSRSVVSNSAMPWTVARQASPSVGLCRQEYWSGLPFPSPRDLPNPGSNPSLLCFSHWQADGKPSHWVRRPENHNLLLEPVKLLSCVWLFATPWTVAYWAPPSMEFSRQVYWSGLPFPSPGDLPDPGIEPRSPAL